MAQTVVIGIVVVLVLGISTQWIAWRFKLPSILLLLILGFLAGPVTGILDPTRLQGDWVFAFVSLSVGIILFEAGLSLHISELREVGKAIRNLITIGAFITWALAGLAAYFVTGFNIEISVLMGALLTVTGPTVIIPILRHVRPTGRIGAVARWEGITMDPIGAILSVFVLEVILLLHSPSGGEGVQNVVLHTLEGIFTVLAVGVGIGFLGAALLIAMLRRRLVPDYLQNALALMAVVAAFALSNIIHEETGLFTATLMGVIMANQPYVPTRQLEEFKEDLRVLLLPALFILLSARLELSVLEYIDARALAFLAILIVLVRPISVFVAGIGTNLNWKEKIFMSWLAPRGVVATAVASLFGLRLAAVSPDAAARLVPIIFLVIVGTVAIYGLTLGPLARRLGLADQNPQGILIVGAHQWARKIAKAIYDRGLNVLVIDSNARNVQRARQEELLAEHANALSDTIIDQLDLSGIGRLAALTPNAEVNALAALHFNEVFESADIYQLANRTEQPNKRQVTLPRHLRGHLLFGSDVTFASMDERFESGDEIRPFELTDQLTYSDLKEHYGEDFLPLFLIRKQGQLLLFSEEEAPNPALGDTVLALVTPSGDEETWEPKVARRAPARDTQLYESVVGQAEVLDVDDNLTYEALVGRVSTTLAPRVPLNEQALRDMYLGDGRGERIVISQGAALPHFRIPDIENPELVIVRCRKGLKKLETEDATEEVSPTSSSNPVYALFFLVSPEDHPSRHLRVLSQLASRIDDDRFLDEWLAADNAEEIKAILLRKSAYVADVTE